MKGLQFQEILSSASKYYLLVDPLVALSRTDITDGTYACYKGADCPIVYVDTVYDLYKMFFYNKVGDYLYDYFSYINPMIYNTKRFTMVANYDFYYGKNFRWYSYKGDNFKTVNYNEIDKKADTPKILINTYIYI